MPFVIGKRCDDAHCSSPSVTSSPCIEAAWLILSTAPQMGHARNRQNSARINSVSVLAHRQYTFLYAPSASLKLSNINKAHSNGWAFLAPERCCSMRFIDACRSTYRPSKYSLRESLSSAHFFNGPRSHSSIVTPI